MASASLFQGCSGKEVRLLQQNLQKLGYYLDGAIDGSFGPLTHAAVAEFQESAQIYVDGIVGPQTREAMSAALKKITSAVTGAKKAAYTGSPSVPVAKPADKTAPRQADVAIRYDPPGKKNARNSSEMMKYLRSFTYTDPATGEADSVSIELCNISMIWANQWLPKKGDKFSAAINTLNWAKPGIKTVFDCGTFCCDDRNFTFPGDSTATINGTSVPEKQAFRSTQRSKTWNNVTLKEIARRIADRYRLQLIYDASTIRIESMEQNEKDDCSFLMDACQEYGLYIKVYRGQIVIYDADRYEAAKAVDSIDFADVISGDYNSTLTGTYTGVSIKYTKGSDKEEYTYKTGSDERLLVINEKVDSLEDAKIKAKARLAEENRKAETIRLTIASPEKRLRSSSCFTLKNAYELSGKYFIDKITHNLDAGSGYTIDIDAHRVYRTETTAKKSKGKTTTSVQDSGRSARDAGIRAGDRVIVNGNAYYHGNGGTYNICSNMEMYVTEVLGGGYIYQYGVAKRAGGARYGWCARDSLTKA